jgi:uncharacterized protein with NRDE domain
MCTVSWVREENGYHLFCNRDEKWTRKPALPPRPDARRGVRFLAPVDGDFGGSWIGVNEFGVSCCLLNGTDVEESGQRAAAPVRSRGLLLLDLIPCASAAEMCDSLRRADLSPYAPFTFAAVECAEPAAIVRWTGSEATVAREAGPHRMLTSSSFDSAEVRRRRGELYRRLAGPREQTTPGQLLAFHHSHNPEPSPYSTCMHRPDAGTVSFSQVRVSPADIEFFYTPSAPCHQAPAVRQQLIRSAR